VIWTNADICRLTADRMMLSGSAEERNQKRENKK
jgi:hypothetical protein